jgi:hypothetical protein
MAGPGFAVGVGDLVVEALEDPGGALRAASSLPIFSIDKNLDVLGDGLTRGREAVLARKPPADLEQGLAISAR